MGNSLAKGSKTQSKQKQQIRVLLKNNVHIIKFEFITFSILFGPIDPIDNPMVAAIQSVLYVVGFIVIVMLLAARCFGTGRQSGEVRITRPRSDKIDAFGGARARDYSHMPSRPTGKGGLPVSLRKERERTATFREGAKDRVEEEKKPHSD